MYFGVLGPLEVTNSAGAVRLRGPRQRVLLCALLSAVNDVVSVDRLIYWLWPTRPPASAAGTIQEQISRLRRALEPDRTPWSDSQLLIRRPPGYLLRASTEQVDALSFEALVDRGQTALERGRPAEAAQLLQQALRLWRGRAFADVALLDAAQEAIARLEGSRLSATALRIDAELALGRHVALVPELEALVRAYPFDERLAGQLMIALYRCGRQAHALAVYQRLCEILGEELAIEPAPASQRLQAAILAHDPELDHGSGALADGYRW